jgi:hypothetical protein
MKAVLKVIGIILSIGVIWPLIFETNNWGINWLDHHDRLHRWLLFALALPCALVAGIIIGSWKAFKTPVATETYAGETNWNPAWGWAGAALIVNVAIILLLE